MSDNIPQEIQLEIIKKVSDVKSLIRFRSVSKPWKSFIDSHEFIAFYGVPHTQPHRLLLRYENDVIPREFEYISFVDDVTFPQQQIDFAPNVPDLVKQLYNPKVIGSSCDLWCLYGSRKWLTEPDMVVIWNPSIRKSVGILLPGDLAKSFGTITRFGSSEKITRFGFGVCPSTYDPTIVRMSYPRFKREIDKWHVEIFTLSSKTWKMIPSSNMPRELVGVRPSTQVATNGFIFWVAYDRIDANLLNVKNSILSFDLITHEFKMVNLPVSIANAGIIDISISELNKSLVVSTYTNEVNDGRLYGVWMMGEEVGVKTSFRKLFNIKTPDDLSIGEVLGFTMNGEPIMETEKDDGEPAKDGELAKVKVFKPYSEQIHDLGINGEICSFFICPYIETLLLVDHLDCSIISHDS